MSARITVEEAHAAVATGALLVCSYDSDEKFVHNHLEGAISLAELRRREESLSPMQELIFYCACPGDGGAAHRADDYRARGFTNSVTLLGGVKEWTAAGYGQVPAATNP